ncbi:MAG: cell division ATP-binding protein FtsE [Gammaproteobacteria bacterium]|nr:MAG: cell division ATP-binding protein FtsE [Gammaproteobacteria bacterium]
MIRLSRVCKRYAGGHEALRDLDLHIREGELVFLTGHSGAGKTTLLKLLALMERPTRGQIYVNQVNLNKLGARKIPSYRRQLGIVFQDHRLLYDRTVLENVAMPLLIRGELGDHEVSKRARAALDKVGLLDREKLKPIHLSTGEQQRVGVARAVVHKPPVLLADEPTGNLDPDLSAEVMNLFVEFNRVGTTVLIASHDLSLIRTMGRKIISLEKGKWVRSDDS